MRCEHPEHPGRAVRLGYGMNLLPSRDAAGVLEGLRCVALPLRARFGAPFGVGAWLPARAARELAAGGRRLEELAGLCAEAGLDLFGFNAFPQGDFHGPGLKQRVFEPTWKDPARLAFTLDVARVAAELARRGGAGRGHLSISTHAGLFGADLRPGDREAVAAAFRRAARELAALEERTGQRVVLALEPEPRSSANDTRELRALLGEVRDGAGPARAAALRHLGACLDACHAAVEFEEPEEALARATAEGTPLGKLQFSSALALADPGRDAAARRAFLALDEPVYLHQVTGRRGAELLRATDLAELARDPDGWAACDEWRCHFHVPVDLAAHGAAGLATTRPLAERALAAALAHPERWGSSELHLEVETYTWSLFAPSADARTWIDGLERELRHVLALLARAGWLPR